MHDPLDVHPELKKQNYTELYELLEEAEEIQEALRAHKLYQIIPNKRQREYINSHCRFNMLCGLNQGGKSTAGQIKTTYHITGRYPDWYTGHRFEEPIYCLIGGETDERTRDNISDDLFGSRSDRGSGFIPSCDFDPPSEHIVVKTGGATGLIDIARVKHYNPAGEFDGYSTVKFFSYNQVHMAGYTPDYIFIDEEPPIEVWNELKARFNKTRGFMDIVMTPLDGYTDLYNKYHDDKTGLFRMIHYTIDDAEHLSKERKKELLKEYSGDLQMRTRLYGEPTVGSGAIYPVDLYNHVIDPQQIPGTFKRIIGLDFAHTAGHWAATSWAIDPHLEEWWLVGAYKQAGVSSSAFADAVKGLNGAIIPCAWPHDNRIQSDGRRIKQVLQDHGLRMLPSHAHFVVAAGPDKLQKVNHTDLAIKRGRELMEGGRLKVFNTPNCMEFVRECRQYRQKEGDIVRHQDDHLIDSFHKAIFMERHAKPLFEIGGLDSEAAMASASYDWDVFDY